MACLRLFTRPPLPPSPDRNVSFFLRRMALLTVFCADFPYRGMVPPLANVHFDGGCLCMYLGYLS